MTSPCANGCGGHAGRGHSLCQMCRVERNNSLPGESAGRDVDPDTLEYECTACGTEYEGADDPTCPDCGARRRRYIGPLDGDRPVATDGGDLVECCRVATIQECPSCGELAIGDCDCGVSD